MRTADQSRHAVFGLIGLPVTAAPMSRASGPGKDEETPAILLFDYCAVLGWATPQRCGPRACRTFAVRGPVAGQGRWNSSAV